MQETSRLSWEDYRYILAISRAEGASKAADTLGVNVSTAFRRLEKIERSIETLLFDRSRKGYLPTAAGREIIHAAEIMEQAAFTADRIVTGHDQRLMGEIRVTATEALAACFLPRHIKSFQKKHPGLSVTILSENSILSLAEREADIALRPKRPSNEALIGRKIASFTWGIYGNSDVVKALGSTDDPKNLAGQQFVVWTGSALAVASQEWLEKTVPDIKMTCRSGSLVTNAVLASNAVGLTMLPCLLGASWPGLKPVMAPLVDFGAAGEIWLVFHKDMRQNARIRAFIDHVVEAAKGDSALFDGTGPLRDASGSL
jgi:DNA-binding transcriptional LysR family regulator